jgi:hypothetical protein
MILLFKTKREVAFRDRRFKYRISGYNGFLTVSRSPRAVYVQFSNHTQLKTDQTHSNASPSAQAALQAAQALVGTGGDTGKETVRFVLLFALFAALQAAQALVGPVAHWQRFQSES